MSNMVLHQSDQSFYPYAKWCIQSAGTGGASDSYRIWYSFGGVEDGDLLVFAEEYYDDGTASINGTVSVPSDPVINIGDWTGSYLSGEFRDAVSPKMILASSTNNANSGTDDDITRAWFLPVTLNEKFRKDMELVADSSNGQDVADEYLFLACFSITDGRVVGRINSSTTKANVTIPWEYGSYGGPSAPIAFLPEIKKFSSSEKTFNARIKVLGYATINTDDAQLSGVFESNGGNIFSLSGSWSGASTTYSKSEAITASNQGKLFVIRMLTYNSTSQGVFTTSEIECTKIWSFANYSGVTDGGIYCDCLRVNQGAVSWESSITAAGPYQRGTVLQSYLVTY